MPIPTPPIIPPPKAGVNGGAAAGGYLVGLPYDAVIRQRLLQLVNLSLGEVGVVSEVQPRELPEAVDGAKMEEQKPYGLTRDFIRFLRLGSYETG